jgi:DNA processing protein
MTDDIRLARIALGHLIEPGSRDLGIIVNRVGPVEALARLIGGRVPKRLREQAAPRLRAFDPVAVAALALDRADRIGVRIITPEDEEWPAQLTDLESISLDVRDPIERDTYPPHCIWLRGPWPLAETLDRSVAIVGSRASTSYGDHMAAELAHGLAERGWAVVSGGAIGIDAAAHRGAVAGSGRTVAVLACGIDRPYPPSNAQLLARIGDEGLLLSEWPPGADPHRHRFLVRNRVIAAASQGTVMVEANRRSGARFTLKRAHMLNRLCLAVPGPATSAMSQGCHDEIRDRRAVLVATVEQILDSVGRIGADAEAPPLFDLTPRDRLDPLEARVLDGVRPRKILTAEEIAVAVGVSHREARRTLPALQLAGFVTQVDAGYRLPRKSDTA